MSTEVHQPDPADTDGSARRPGGASTGLITIVGALIVGALVATAGSVGGMRVGGFPVFALCALLALAINWIAFVPAWLGRTERFYDLVGTVSYLAVVTLALVAGSGSATSMLLAALIAVWALRLGWFLVSRIRRDGNDGRFDTIKTDPVKFLVSWTLQALWVVMTAGAALAAMTSDVDVAFVCVFTFVGVPVWLLGFAIEATADAQKRRFRSDPANRGRFITTGLWSVSRHPNYFGEITLWVGIAIITLPLLTGWQYVTLISPFFVTLLLTRISGIPMLESRAKKRWGDDPEYVAYVNRTSVLVPRQPSRK